MVNIELDAARSKGLGSGTEGSIHTSAATFSEEMSHEFQTHFSYFAANGINAIHIAFAKRLTEATQIVRDPRRRRGN